MIRANPVVNHYKDTRWWFEIFFGIFTPKIGEEFQVDAAIFFRWVGKNHQPVFAEKNTRRNGTIFMAGQPTPP